MSKKTPKSEQFTFLKNAFANLARGGVGAVVAIFLPALLVRHMSQQLYGVWSLVLQVAAYVGYLDFGLQTAIGRYVAFAEEKADAELRDSVLSTAFAGLCIAAAISSLFILCAVWFARFFFPALPPQLLPSMRLTLLIIGLSMSLGLPSSAWNGVFVGLQKYEIPALTVGGAKLLAAIAIAVVALNGESMTHMAIAMAAVNVASYGAQFLCFRLVAPALRIRRSLIRLSTARELSSYCFSLTVWSFTMLLVNGLDLLLVGRFDFTALGPYALASSLVTFMAGSQAAIFTSMMPQAAAAHAGGNADKLGRLVLTATRGGTVLLILSGLSLFIYSTPLLHLWVGAAYAAHVHRFLSILLLGNMIRLVWIPYSVVLVGAGQQKLLTVAPLLEGMTNLIASLFLGSRYGAAGVAGGTLIGAVIGSLVNVFYSLKHTQKHVSFGTATFLWRSLALPGLTGMPLLLLFAVNGSLQWPFAAAAFLASGALAAFIIKPAFAFVSKRGLKVAAVRPAQ